MHICTLSSNLHNVKANCLIFPAQLNSSQKKINLLIFSVEAPAWQGAKVRELKAYSEHSQRSQEGCSSAKNVNLFLREP